MRQAAEKASGLLSQRGIWRMTGSAHFHGANQTFALLFDTHFRFRMNLTGEILDTNAFDGSTCWTSGPSEAPHRLILHDRDVDRLVAWTLTGAWAARGAPLVCQQVTLPDGKPAISLRPRDGEVAGTLQLDAATSLPASLRYGTDSGEEIWTFTDYKNFNGYNLPTRILHRSGKQEDSITISTVEPAREEAATFRMPKRNPSKVAFEASADPAVEIKRAAGLLFVHPKIDGQEVGWFILDTGADGMCIEPTVAQKLGLSVVGEDTVAGVVGVTHLNICRAGTFQLGPATLKNPFFLELDLSAVARALHMPIGGICGYDFLAQTSLDIAPRENVLRIFPPGSAALPAGARWTRIGFDSNVPCLICSFADNHRGFFTLDTGSTATVDFFTPAVEKFHLLAYQDQSREHTGGAGGTAESRRGQIAWFKLGDRTFEKPTVGFQLTKAGVFSSPYRTGNIGIGFLGQFRLLLDYANERVAFVNTK